MTEYASIRKFLRETNPTKKLFLWNRREAWLFFFPQPSRSLHVTVRLIFHRGDLHAVCMHIAFGWEKEVFYKNTSLEITVAKGKDHFIS